MLQGFRFMHYLETVWPQRNNNIIIAININVHQVQLLVIYWRMFMIDVQ